MFATTTPTPPKKHVTMLKPCFNRPNYNMLTRIRPQSTPGPATEITSKRQSKRQHAQPRENRTTIV